MSVTSVHYVGLDVHKKVVAFCVKTKKGTSREEGMIPATRKALSDWLAKRKQPWTGAMEATPVTDGTNDYLSPPQSRS